jgi:hypothetical protein
MKKQKQMTLGVSLACAIFCGSVLADPKEGGPASCFGYEAADVSPPGSEDGTFSQFGMPGILAFIDSFIDLGIFKNRGQAVQNLSHFHEGSHEACDVAVGVPPEEE